MRAIFYILFICFSTFSAEAQTVFDTATCGGVNKLAGFSADKIFTKSQEWLKENIQPITYTENQTNGSIILAALEDYNARASDKLPSQYNGKFEYTFIVSAKDGYYSYDFVNVKYIPQDKVEDALADPENSDRKPLRIKKRVWDKITKSAFRQLQEKGKNYDTFMQKC